MAKSLEPRVKLNTLLLLYCISSACRLQVRLHFLCIGLSLLTLSSPTFVRTIPFRKALDPQCPSIEHSSKPVDVGSNLHHFLDSGRMYTPCHFTNNHRLATEPSATMQVVYRSLDKARWCSGCYAKTPQASRSSPVLMGLIQCEVNVDRIPTICFGGGGRTSRYVVARRGAMRR